MKYVLIVLGVVVVGALIFGGFTAASLPQIPAAIDSWMCRVLNIGCSTTPDPKPEPDPDIIPNPDPKSD